MLLQVQTEDGALCIAEVNCAGKERDMQHCQQQAAKSGSAAPIVSLTALLPSRVGSAASRYVISMLLSKSRSGISDLFSISSVSASDTNPN